jgi:hypothetical protein
MRHTLARLALAATLAAAGTAQAASVTLFTNLAAWEAAVTGSAQVQDFSTYNTGDDLTGVQVLPGLTLSSNIGGPMHVFGANNVATAFGPARQAGNAYYEGSYALPFLAAALDITSFESVPGDGTTAIDDGVLSFLFSDGTTQDFLVSGNATGSPIFMGVIADSAITSFRWTEAHEASQGNEETGLDNFRVAMRDTNQVPLPGTLPLALLAMGVLPLVRRRRG